MRMISDSDRRIDGMLKDLEEEAKKKEEEGSQPWLTVIGRGKFINSCLPSQSLWIERKLFYVFSLIPGRTIRLIEMLSDRRFTVDFKANEVPWVIGVLREAASARSGSDFSKRATIGSRSLKVSTVRNRAGVFIQLLCSCGGKNRRLIFIPAGVNGNGWRSLAKLLASAAVGGSTSFKSISSSSSPSCPNPVPNLLLHPCREAAVVPRVSFAEVTKGLSSEKGKTPADSEWKSGSLPSLLKVGLKLSLGAPSTSGEASRSFAWKEIQSEIGAGTLVVELFSGAEQYPQRHVDVQQLRERERVVGAALVKKLPPLTATMLFRGIKGSAGQDTEK